MKMIEEQGCWFMLNNQFSQELLVIYGKIVVGLFVLKVQRNVSKSKRMSVFVFAFAVLTVLSFVLTSTMPNLQLYA